MKLNSTESLPAQGIDVKYSLVNVPDVHYRVQLTNADGNVTTHWCGRFDEAERFIHHHGAEGGKVELFLVEERLIILGE